VNKMEQKSTQPVLTLSQAVFKFGMEKNLAKKDVVKKIVDYYTNKGIKNTKGLKLMFRNKIDPINAEYISKFIDTVVVDFPKKTGWRSEFKMSDEKSVWQIVRRDPSEITWNIKKHQ
jgi:hypothetical protein